MKFFGIVKPDYLINAFVTPIFVDKDKFFLQKIDYNTNLILDFAAVQVEKKHIEIINHKLLQQEIKIGNGAIFAYRSDSFDETIIGGKEELDKILFEFLYRDFDKNPFPKVIISNFIGLHDKTLWFIKETNVFLNKQTFEFIVNPYNYLPDEEEAFNIYKFFEYLKKIENKTTEIETTYRNYIGFYEEKMYINYVYYNVNKVYEHLIDTIPEDKIINSGTFNTFISVLKNYVNTHPDNNNYDKLYKWQKLLKIYDNKEDKEKRVSGSDYKKEREKLLFDRLMVFG
jgi:hypothetical protein